MQENLQDQEIIRQVLEGRQQSYALLVDRYRNFVFTITLRYIKNREEAEEVAQDVFVKAYRSLADFRMQSKFSTWLYTIVSTSCISYLRGRKVNIVHMEEEQMHTMTQSAGMMEKPSALSESRSERQMIEQVLARLPEPDALVLRYFYQGEQSLDEIGKILGLTPNHVKVKLFRARQKMKEMLKEHYPEELKMR
jgi:RNA polymerase sigma factor (sigma-70 family)